LDVMIKSINKYKYRATQKWIKKQSY
jgi:hypothetical protein